VLKVDVYPKLGIHEFARTNHPLRVARSKVLCLESLQAVHGSVCRVHELDGACLSNMDAFGLAWAELVEEGSAFDLAKLKIHVLRRRMRGDLLGQCCLADLRPGILMPSQ